MGKLLRVVFWSLPVSSRPIDTALCQGTGWSAVTPFMGLNGVTEESIWLAWGCRSLSSAHLRVGIPFVSSRALFLAALRNRPLAEPGLTAAPSPTQEARGGLRRRTRPRRPGLASRAVSLLGAGPEARGGRGRESAARAGSSGPAQGEGPRCRECIWWRAGVVTQRPTGRPT